MAASVRASVVAGTFRRLVSACSRGILRPSGLGAAPLWSASRRVRAQSTSFPQGYVPKTSLSSPPWTEIVLPDPVEEARHHAVLAPGTQQVQEAVGWSLQNPLQQLLGPPSPGPSLTKFQSIRDGLLDPSLEAWIQECQESLSVLEGSAVEKQWSRPGRGKQTIQGWAGVSVRGPGLVKGAPAGMGWRRGFREGLLPPEERWCTAVSGDRRSHSVPEKPSRALGTGSAGNKHASRRGCRPVSAGSPASKTPGNPDCPAESSSSKLLSGSAPEVVGRVNELIATGQYGRLFAVVHFAGHQWKVTSEDLILIENELDVACGERIRLEKVLLVGADNFTLLGKPLLGRDLVRVEATVIEKTESWPKIYMKFIRRKNFRKKKIIVTPQTVLRINTVEVAPCLL